VAGYLIVPTRRSNGIDVRTGAQTAQPLAAPRLAGRQLLSKLAGMALGLVAQRGVEILGRQVESLMASRRQAADLGRRSDEESDQHDYE
jgi:hypothetical protein